MEPFGTREPIYDSFLTKTRRLRGEFQKQMSQIRHRLDIIAQSSTVTEGTRRGVKLSGAWDCRVKIRDPSCKVFISGHLGLSKRLFQDPAADLLIPKNKMLVLGSQDKRIRSREKRKTKRLDVDINTNSDFLYPSILSPHRKTYAVK